MALTESDIQLGLNRRRPGQTSITTPPKRKGPRHHPEWHRVWGHLGTPIGMLFRNEDQRPKDYGNSTMDRFPRLSHASWTYLEKYGVKAFSGGGRSSARETIARVAAGNLAENYLR
ncbi:hypothetical protein LY78DRAFT_675257 [Colletotrichum sublineola]|uniref:chorismate synthase n=1 Tax=Colletotrichum sublineola TaxID=1173701 RepID=A0A066XDD9_COLSU|nr:hypothetical protein LY78DRAFT_675257 [Colletotrichum sublineola]KDN63751.1 putative chorismate synthase [Colletotrichum sublineola]